MPTSSRLVPIARTAAAAKPPPMKMTAAAGTD